MTFRQNLPSLLAFASLTLSSFAKVPDKLVVLTFDDSAISHAVTVAPILKEFGFGGTFFITEGFEFKKDKNSYMTWEQIKGLHDAGFEIGNHTQAHKVVRGRDAADLNADFAYIEKQCQEHGIPKPVSFCYPAYQTSEVAVDVLKERGYKFARAGGAQAFDPSADNPLLLPQAFDGKPGSTPQQFEEAVAKAKDGKVAVMTFHGIPDHPHPWVSTSEEKFRKYMRHLKDEGCKVIALRDLGCYLP
jgi:peptidoglycan/xylan/chitin deacetylase (PgdA/CDA1 family)